MLIKKYGSTSYLRIGQVLKWPPIHKVKEKLNEKRNREVQKANKLHPLATLLLNLLCI